MYTGSVNATVASASSTESNVKITVDELALPAQADASWKSEVFSKTIGYFTVSVDAIKCATKPSYNAEKKNVRLYATNGTTLSISSSTKTIKKIEFNAKAQPKSGKAFSITASDGTLTDDYKKWTGSSNNIKIKVDGEAGNWEVYDFTIYYE